MKVNTRQVFESWHMSGIWKLTHVRYLKVDTRQVRDAKSDKCSLPCVPPHSCWRHSLIHHHAHGNHLAGRYWGIIIILKRIESWYISVACGEFRVQGFDDGPDWWLHPLLPHAYCSFHRQVASMVIFMMMIADYSQVYQHQQPTLLSEQREAEKAGEVMIPNIFNHVLPNPTQHRNYKKEIWI